MPIETTALKAALQRFPLLLSALLLVAPVPGEALDVNLNVTLPANKSAYQIVPPSERATPADSISILCGVSGASMDDLDSLFLYGQPSSGGPRRKVWGTSVRGLQGQAYSFGPISLPWIGGHFDITTKRISSLESCPSNRVYIGTVTGVEPEPIDRVIEVRRYDVHGRRSSAKATGIYFERVWYKSGRVVTRRIVYVK